MHYIICAQQDEKSRKWEGGASGSPGREMVLVRFVGGNRNHPCSRATHFLLDSAHTSLRAKAWTAGSPGVWKVRPLGGLRVLLVDFLVKRRCKEGNGICPIATQLSHWQPIEFAQTSTPRAQTTDSSIGCKLCGKWPVGVWRVGLMHSLKLMS